MRRVMFWIGRQERSLRFVFTRLFEADDQLTTSNLRVGRVCTAKKHEVGICTKNGCRQKKKKEKNHEKKKRMCVTKWLEKARNIAEANRRKEKKKKGKERVLGRDVYKMKKKDDTGRMLGCLRVSLQHLGDDFEMLLGLVAPRPAWTITVMKMAVVLLCRWGRRGSRLSRACVGGTLGSNGLNEHGVAWALHQIHDGFAGLLKNLGVVVTHGHRPQETAADSIRKVDLMRAAGEDKCLEDGAHLDLEVGEGAGLGLVEVDGGIAVEGEHGRRGLDWLEQRLGAQLREEREKWKRYIVNIMLLEREKRKSESMYACEMRWGEAATGR